ncbi:hypothetical protein ACFV42_49715 [Streptomyces solisilvae]|uniref:hypothetical protein n=1 Tax=Streptomyces malaysiensis TaxID=92644 RepID=UPI00367F5756
MGKKNMQPEGDMLPFEGEADFESTSLLMTNRTRFEAMSPAARARLSEALVAAPTAMVVDGFRVDRAELEDSWQDFLSGALDAVESIRSKNTCAICHSPYEEGDVRVEQRVDWYGEDGRKMHGEPTGEDAHDRCVKRLRDGGDAETKPMF